MKKALRFNSKTIHGGQAPEEATGAVMPPVFFTSTYAQKTPGVHKGFAYSRGENPTRTALEKNLATLENGSDAFTFGSGIAAIDAVLRILKPGDHVIANDNVYGGTYRLFTKLFSQYGLDFSFINMESPTSLEEVVTKKTKLVWIETPSNPLMKISDIAQITSLVKKKNSSILVGVDNTFATPFLQQPLDLGVDIVMHSVTKYLGGHSDIMMGALVVNNTLLAEQIHFMQFAAGAIPSPMDCFLALRGIKTLHVRMQRHCENALEVAKFLQQHPKVGKVFYPGFTSHPNHQIAKKQMRDFGGMVSFSFKKDTKESAFQFLEKLQVFTLAESLGGIESLANYSASMTHASVPKEERLKMGITDSLVRLSVGIEAIEDLLEDVQQALE